MGSCCFFACFDKFPSCFCTKNPCAFVGCFRRACLAGEKLQQKKKQWISSPPECRRGHLSTALNGIIFSFGGKSPPWVHELKHLDDVFQSWNSNSSLQELHGLVTSALNIQALKFFVALVDRAGHGQGWGCGGWFRWSGWWRLWVSSMQLELCHSLYHPACPQWPSQWLHLASLHPLLPRKWLACGAGRSCTRSWLLLSGIDSTDATGGWLLADSAAFCYPLGIRRSGLHLLWPGVGCVCRDTGSLHHRSNLCYRRPCIWYLWQLRSPGKKGSFNFVVCLYHLRRLGLHYRWNCLRLLQLERHCHLAHHLWITSPIHAGHSAFNEAVFHGGLVSNERAFREDRGGSSRGKFDKGSQYRCSQWCKWNLPACLTRSCGCWRRPCSWGGWGIYDLWSTETTDRCNCVRSQAKQD